MIARTYFNLIEVDDAGDNMGTSGASPFNLKFGDGEPIDLNFSSKVAVSDWDSISVMCESSYDVSISMDAEAESVWANRNFTVIVETVAYQYNAVLTDEWDGTVDTGTIC